MKIFRNSKKYLQLLGYSDFDLDASEFECFGLSLNFVRSCATFIAHLFVLIPALVFLCFEAKHLLEIFDSFFYVACGIYLLTLYLVFLWEQPHIIQLINDLEDMIESSNFIPVLLNKNFT